MAKKNKKNKNVAPSNNVNIVFPESLSADEIKNILVDAMLEVENKKAEAQKDKADKDLKEWRESLGIKEYPKDAKIRFRRAKQFFNTFGAFFRLSFISKKKIKGDRATTGLLKFFLAIIFDVAKFALTVWSALLVLSIPMQYIVDSITILTIPQNILVFCFAILSFILSRLFRIASVEIENIDDKNYLFGVFASITSIVSIIVAIVSIFK